MKYSNGFWFPDSETHFIQYLTDVSPEYQYMPKKCLDVIVTDWRCVLDIGSHVGTWATWFAKRSRNVHCFEPISENFECLEKNTEGLACTLYNRAVSDEAKIIPMWKPHVATNSGTFSSVPVEDWKQTEIEAITIDSLGLNPTVMKLDIQGGEYAALLGSKETINRCRPVICCEENHEDAENRDKLQDLFASLGYRKVYKFKEDAFWLHETVELTKEQIAILPVKKKKL